MHKRYNKICTIRLFQTTYFSKILRFVVIEENSTTEQFKNFKQLICYIEFLKISNTCIFNNTAVNIRGEINTLIDSLRNVGIDFINLPTWSPKLDLIELNWYLVLWFKDLNLNLTRLIF